MDEEELMIQRAIELSEREEQVRREMEENERQQQVIRMAQAQATRDAEDLERRRRQEADEAERAA